MDKEKFLTSLFSLLVLLSLLVIAFGIGQIRTVSSNGIRITSIDELKIYAENKVTEINEIKWGNFSPPSDTKTVTAWIYTSKSMVIRHYDTSLKSLGSSILIWIGNGWFKWENNTAYAVDLTWSKIMFKMQPSTSAPSGAFSFTYNFVQLY